MRIVTTFLARLGARKVMALSTTRALWWLPVTKSGWHWRLLSPDSSFDICQTRDIWDVSIEMCWILSQPLTKLLCPSRNVVKGEDEDSSLKSDAFFRSGGHGPTLARRPCDTHYFIYHQSVWLTDKLEILFLGMRARFPRNWQCIPGIEKGLPPLPLP